MIPFSFSWDTQKRMVSLKWNGFLSLVWKKGKVLTRILGFRIPLHFRRERVGLSMRWVCVKKAFSFLRKWKLKRVEGTLSFPDPVVNGLLYGWISILETRKEDQKIRLSINFLGENRFSGEATISSKTFFHHLTRWVFFLLQEKRRRRSRRGGESSWRLPI